MWKELTCGQGPSEWGSTPVRVVPSGPGRCRTRTGTTKEAGGAEEKASNQTTARAPRAPPLKASTDGEQGKRSLAGNVDLGAQAAAADEGVGATLQRLAFGGAEQLAAGADAASRRLSSRLLPVARASSMPCRRGSGEPSSVPSRPEKLIETGAGRWRGSRCGEKLGVEGDDHVADLGAPGAGGRGERSGRGEAPRREQHRRGESLALCHGRWKRGAPSHSPIRSATA